MGLFDRQSRTHRIIDPFGGPVMTDSDDTLSPIARACIANARRALAAANASLAPDRRPFVPPTPETPAERVQGEAGEVAE